MEKSYTSTAEQNYDEEATVMTKMMTKHIAIIMAIFSALFFLSAYN